MMAPKNFIDPKAVLVPTEWERARNEMQRQERQAQAYTIYKQSFELACRVSRFTLECFKMLCHRERPSYEDASALFKSLY